MAIRLFVHAANIRATVDFNSPQVVAPAFQKASVSISRPVYQTVVTYSDLQAMTNYRQLVSSVNYRHPNFTDVFLDPDTKNRYFRGDRGESFSLAEQAALTITKRPDELVDLVEAAKLGVTKPLTESVGFADVAQVLLILNRFFTETASLNESSAIEFGKTAADAVSLSESRSKQVGKGLEDTFSLAEELEYNFGKGLADTATVTESLARAVSYIRDFQDSTSLSDAPSLLYGKNQSDSVSMSQVFSRVVQFERTFNDTLTINDAATVGALVKDTTSLRDNVFGVNDVFSRVFVASRVFTESVSVSESLVLAKRSRASSLLNAGAMNVAPINN